MLRVSNSYSEVWRIAWPIILSSLANTVINFTDTAFVARVGETELAASALGGVFYFVLVMVGMAFGIGAQIIIARKAGEENSSAIGFVYDNSLVVLLVVAAFMEVLVYACIPSFMHAIIHDPKVADACVVYLQARGWGLACMMILISLRSFYTGISQTRIITYTTVVMMLLNIVFNYFLTLGHGGFAPLGIFGVGLSSALAEATATIYAIVYTFVHKSIRPFRLFRFARIELSTIFQVIQLSAPIVLQHLLSMGAWFIFFLMIEKMGQRDLAISNVVRSAYMVLMTPVWGFSQATNSMVSNVIGQKKLEEVGGLVRKIVYLSVLITVLLTAFFVIFPGPLFSLITTDAQMMHDAMGSYYIIAFANMIFAAGMILLSAVSGTGDTKAAMYIEIVNIAIYLIHVFVTAGFLHTSVEVVWIAEVDYWLLMGLFSVYYLRSGRWRKQAMTLQ